MCRIVLTYGLTLDRRGAATESGVLTHSLALSALHAPTENCIRTGNSFFID
jgi:hypothetical protein